MLLQEQELVNILIYYAIISLYIDFYWFLQKIEPTFDLMLLFILYTDRRLSENELNPKLEILEKSA